MNYPRNHSVMLLPALVAPLLLSSCVWKSDYDALQQQNQQLQGQNQELQAHNQQLQQQVSENDARISRLQGAIKYTVNSDLLFPPGKWEMSAQGQQIIARLATKLAPTMTTKLVVNGYTDNAPIGPALRRDGVTSNVDLSQKRAESVVQYLVSQGVKPDLLSALGHGDSDPVASNATPQGRTQNRRVEITMASPTG